MTYSESANLAVNQTLVRSINTSIIALLPVAAILFVGVGLLGAGTLKDLSLALFIGLAAGTYSSIFIATPVACQIKEQRPEMKALTARVEARRSAATPSPRAPPLAGPAVRAPDRRPRRRRHRHRPRQRRCGRRGGDLGDQSTRPRRPLRPGRATSRRRRTSRAASASVDERARRAARRARAPGPRLAGPGRDLQGHHAAARRSPGAPRGDPCLVEALAGHGIEGVDRVVGVEARGFILGAPVAVALGVGFVPVRKQGKLPGDVHVESYVLEYGTAVLEMQVDAVGAGDRVLLVDDVLATGGTAAAASALLRTAGAEVVGLAVLIELGACTGAMRSRAYPWSRSARSDAPVPRRRRCSAVDLVRSQLARSSVAEDVVAGSGTDAPAAWRPGTGSSPAIEATSRRLIPRISSRRGSARQSMHPVLEPLFRTVRQFHPKADVEVLEAAYERAAYLHRDQRRRSRRPLHHPPAGRGHDPGRARDDAARPCARRCCTTPSRTRSTPSTRCGRTSATRSPTSSTASPSSTR